MRGEAERVDNYVNHKLKVFHTTWYEKTMYRKYLTITLHSQEAMLERYVDSRRPFMNHEWIYDIDSSHIVNNIITLCDFLGIGYTVEENLETYNNNT